MENVNQSVADQLRACCRRLPAQQQQQLLDFAEFLLARIEPEVCREVSKTPLDIPRPIEETVLQSVKRLRASYPMLDEATLLQPVAALMTAYVVKGRAASTVVDDLEQLFKDGYSDWQQACETHD